MQRAQCDRQGLSETGRFERLPGIGNGRSRQFADSSVRATLMKISLAENFRAIFYAPFYALKSLDFAGREGVEIEWLAPRLPGAAFDAVKSGAVDLTWGGRPDVGRSHARHEGS